MRGPPDDDEAKVLLTWLDRQRTRLAGEPAAASALATGEVPATPVTATATPPAAGTLSVEGTAAEASADHDGRLTPAAANSGPRLDGIGGLDRDGPGATEPG